MRCRRCEFENMPGETTCFRCQAVLVPAGVTGLAPPRAGWAKPFRRVRYWLNRKLGLGWRGKVESGPSTAPGWALIGRERLLVASISLVPGLGHLLSRETRRIFLLWPAWLGMLGLGVFFYGTVCGGLFIGAAVALHAWIICDAAAVHDAFAGRPIRFVIVLAVFGALLLGIYGGARRSAGALVSEAYAPMDFPAERIRSGDFLLVDPRAYRAAAPGRGDIIRYCTRSELQRARRRGSGIHGPSRRDCRADPGHARRGRRLERRPSPHLPRGRTRARPRLSRRVCLAEPDAARAAGPVLLPAAGYRHGAGCRAQVQSQTRRRRRSTSG